MKITPLRVRALIAEMIDENPFACRALLQIVDIVFTTEVRTAAVSCGAQPRLLLNPEFVAKHCRSDEHLKALVCHEFLHVLLRHTACETPPTDAGNLACDAVINAIIHRTLGADYSSFMARYYANETGVARLLRRPGDGEADPRRGKPSAAESALRRAWSSLYEGRLVADDIESLARDLQEPVAPAAGWLGDHESTSSRGIAGECAVSAPVAAALQRALASMNGTGIWRAPRDYGVGREAYASHTSAADVALERWRAEAWRVLRRHLVPDSRGHRSEYEDATSLLPVLSTADRRAFGRALWNPLLPEATWTTPRRSAGASAQVYLDVSGSMCREMPLVIALLARLGRHVRRPFWAFSDRVAPAVIRDGILHADTTGGTSMRCVLEHVAATRPRAAVVVTDGFIESLDPRLVRGIGRMRLHAIVTREGSPAQLARAGIAYTQLGRLPA